MRKKIIAFNAILFALLFGLVSLNKKVLRPSFRDMPFLETLTGEVPAHFVNAPVLPVAPYMN